MTELLKKSADFGLVYKGFWIYFQLCLTTTVKHLAYQFNRSVHKHVLETIIPLSVA